MLRARRSAVVLALSIASVLVLTASVQAAAISGSSHPVLADDVATQARRSIVWVGTPVVSPHAFRINSVSLNAPSPDAFQITYQDGTFTLDYERVEGGGITSHYALTLAGLVEWNGSLGGGPLDESARVAYTPLGAVGFGALPIVHTQTLTTNGIEADSFLVVSNSEEVKVNLTIAQGFVQLPSGDTLTPMEAKLTFEIDHVMSRPGTRLSLQLNVDTSFGATQRVSLDNQSWDDENHFSSDERALNVTNDSGSSPSSAFFAWSNSATVNGQAGTVDVAGPEVNETAGGRDLYLMYPTGPALANPFEITVVHDPTIGVVSAAYASILGGVTTPVLPFQADALIYAVSLVAVAALIGGTAILARRRHREKP